MVLLVFPPWKKSFLASRFFPEYPVIRGSLKIQTFRWCKLLFSAEIMVMSHFFTIAMGWRHQYRWRSSMTFNTALGRSNCQFEQLTPIKPSRARYISRWFRDFLGSVLKCHIAHVLFTCPEMCGVLLQNDFLCKFWLKLGGDPATKIQENWGVDLLYYCRLGRSCALSLPTKRKACMLFAYEECIRF